MEQDLRPALKEMEERNSQLRRKARELAAANQELESFVHSVSHDLRTPLQTIIGFSDLVIEDYGESLNATMLDYMHRILKAARHMDQLITNLLSLSHETKRD